MEDITKKYLRCKRCNRILKSEEAKERGYGKICWEKHLKESQQNLSNTLFDVNQDNKDSKR